jgi:hypothetical protein
MGISNVECATRLRKVTARQAPHVQSKRMIYLFIGSPEGAREVKIKNDDASVLS